MSHYLQMCPKVYNSEWVVDLVAGLSALRILSTGVLWRGLGCGKDVGSLHTLGASSGE